MKILALFLSVFFLFFAGAPVWAESCHPAFLAPGISTVSSAINDLAEAQRCLDTKVQELEIRSDNLKTKLHDLEKSNDDLKTKLHDLQAFGTSNGVLEMGIKDLQDKLKQTELDLHTAKVRIETLENTQASNEHFLTVMTALMAGRPASKPKAAASKPKAPVNKPKPAVDSPKDRSEGVN